MISGNPIKVFITLHACFSWAKFRNLGQTQLATYLHPFDISKDQSKSRNSTVSTHTRIAGHRIFSRNPLMMRCGIAPGKHVGRQGVPGDDIHITATRGHVNHRPRPARQSRAEVCARKVDKITRLEHSRLESSVTPS